MSNSRMPLLDIDLSYPSDPRTRSVTLPEYWKLFWVPLLGLPASALYELLITLLMNGRTAPNSEGLARHLGLSSEELPAIFGKLSKMRLLEHSTNGVRPIFPPPLIGGELLKSLPKELKPSHQSYLEKQGYDVSKLDEPAKAKQIGLLDDFPEEAPAVKVAKKGRKTVMGTEEVVSYYQTRAAKKLGIQKFDFALYAAEMTNASAIINDGYSVDEVKKMIDYFFDKDPASARPTGFRQLRSLSTALANLALKDSRVVPVRKSNSKVVVPSLPGYEKQVEDTPKETEW